MQTIETTEEHRHSHGPNRQAVVPAARRGVTIAFVDSGFGAFDSVVVVG